MAVVGPGPHGHKWLQLEVRVHLGYEGGRIAARGGVHRSANEIGVIARHAPILPGLSSPPSAITLNRLAIGALCPAWKAGTRR